MNEPTIKQIKIQKNKNKGTIEVIIEARPHMIDSLPAEHSAWKKYRTCDIAEILTDAGHRPGEALQEAHVCTYREENLKGTWIFKDLDAKPVKTQQAPRKPRTKTTKTDK
jgi:hypothetical protein